MITSQARFYFDFTESKIILPGKFFLPLNLFCHKKEFLNYFDFTNF